MRERLLAQATADGETCYRCSGQRDPLVQRWEEIKDYQAQRWPHPRRVVAQIERNPQGSQRRFVVTSLLAKPDEVYRDVYVRRGAVPEQPIGELKNGLCADRLSASGFCANAWRRLVHVVAYAWVVLFREANTPVPEVARAEGRTLRQRLWKVPAVLVGKGRRLVLRLSAGWPFAEVLGRALEAVGAFVQGLGVGQPAGAPVPDLPN